jgi:hypothetical protein
MNTKAQQRNLPQNIKMRLALYRQKIETGCVPRRDRLTVQRGRSQAFALRRGDVLSLALRTQTKH